MKKRGKNKMEDKRPDQDERLKEMGIGEVTCDRCMIELYPELDESNCEDCTLNAMKKGDAKQFMDETIAREFSIPLDDLSRRNKILKVQAPLAPQANCTQKKIKASSGTVVFLDWIGTFIEPLGHPGAILWFPFEMYPLGDQHICPVEYRIGDSVQFTFVPGNPDSVAETVKKIGCETAETRRHTGEIVRHGTMVLIASRTCFGGMCMFAKGQCPDKDTPPEGFAIGDKVEFTITAYAGSLVKTIKKIEK